MGDLRTAIYQFGATPDLAPANVRLDRLEQALHGHARNHDGALDLVVCPELFLSGYDIGALVHDRAEPADGPSASRVAAMAQHFGTAIVAGYPERDGEALHNAVMVYGADGQRLLNYRKRLIPPGFEGTYFTPGDSQGVFDLKGWKLAVLVCYDVEFPEYVRQAALGGADLIVAPTALRNMWGFVADIMLPTRAFENGVYVLYANHAGAEGNCEYLGRSVILGPDGKEHARAGDGEALIVATLDRSAILAARATLPYLDVIRGGLPG